MMPSKEEVFNQITELKKQILNEKMSTTRFLLEADLQRLFTLYGLLCYTHETI